MTGTLRIMDRTGDTTMTWTVGNEAETEAVRTEFERLMTQNGYMAYTVDGDGGGTQVRSGEFPADVEAQVVMVPQIIGG